MEPQFLTHASKVYKKGYNRLKGYKDVNYLAMI